MARAALLSVEEQRRASLARFMAAAERALGWGPGTVPERAAIRDYAREVSRLHGVEAGRIAGRELTAWVAGARVRAGKR